MGSHPRGDPRQPARRAVILLRSLLFDAIAYTLMGVMGLVLAPAAAVSSRAALWGIKLWCGIVLWLLRRLCGLRVEVRGRVPQGDVLVAAKHQSFLDVIILSRVLPRPQFVMKQSLKWVPVLGFYAMRIGCTPIRREDQARALRGMLREVKGRRQAGTQTVIYPQGTRAAVGARLPYRPGAAALYRAFELECVPVATNAGHFWARMSLYRRPGMAVVEFLDPIPPGLEPRPFMAELERRIEAASDRLLAEAGTGSPPTR
ncbi:MAG: 1-acyl-sn-glycerol-3-phosphate acyltransferase [Alphaproteobacteria bacterium]|nr:MAG: 1-acyl-sn-glycerol-3-phosphate acyltransferase [Alphaproteobacteria bacterium]